MSGKDIATRVTAGVQALGLAGQRQGWQEQHRASLLTDAQTYDYLADALEADLKGRPVEGDMPWSAARRAKKRARPLREAARAMRKAAKAVGGTVAAYEQSAPEKTAADRAARAERKERKKQLARQAAAGAAARSLERLTPPAGGVEQPRATEEPRTLGDYFGHRKEA
ncbi:hypothetical protein D7231_34965 [Streptomyces klenkii]|uniref:Uncharacterized protein n=1 Tax=Streptomyces klenkii TaxID=1420899 RepID=A0A3B0A3D4_9ACTN|nr:hypothetical protein [Streptomyces klenkii]RKN54829.1 hypothetical protein D7231_34965 [Streptomyces klenkii]